MHRRFVPISRLVGSDLRAWHRSWTDYGGTRKQPLATADLLSQTAPVPKLPVARSPLVRASTMDWPNFFRGRGVHVSLRRQDRSRRAAGRRIAATSRETARHDLAHAAGPAGRAGAQSRRSALPDAILRIAESREPHAPITRSRAPQDLLKGGKAFAREAGRGRGLPVALRQSRKILSGW